MPTNTNKPFGSLRGRLATSITEDFTRPQAISYQVIGKSRIFDSVPLTIWNVDCETGDGTATWSSDYATGVYVLDIAADAGGEAYAQLKGSDMSPISLYRHKPIFEIRASGTSAVC